jgi:NAD-dependent dihydropyrimidine dehydrogenase PreA subunit
MLWFLRGLRRGVVSTRYPRVSERDAWARALPTPPRFDSERLTDELTQELVDVCPARAIGREYRALVLDLGRCTGCGRCLEVGGAAVARSGVFALAVRERADLIKRIPIRGGQT